VPFGRASLDDGSSPAQRLRQHCGRLRLAFVHANFVSGYRNPLSSQANENFGGSSNKATGGKLPQYGESRFVNAT
jgi:hypothetical protein